MEQIVFGTIMWNQEMHWKESEFIFKSETV